MQSFSELCSRIACIVGFLMHTMHTTFSVVHPGNEADGTGLRIRPQKRAMTVRQEMGRDGGGQPVRRAMKARKIQLSAMTGSGVFLFMIRRGMPEDANSRR